MKSPALPLILLASLILAMATVSCQFASRLMGGGNPSPSPSRSLSQPFKSPTSALHATQLPPSPQGTPLTPVPATEVPPSQPTSGRVPSQIPATPETCSKDTCIEDGTFLLERPIGGHGRVAIDHSYRYGEYRGSTRDTHHGVDFLNSTGIPVLAAADGVVVVAGDDLRTVYALTPNTYGNLVILKHEPPSLSKPLFTLYADLSQISVKVHDEVKAGQEIGLVGMSGRVTGSTLHFEVRLGENTYQAARNPELWLKPLEDENGQSLGALAGSVSDTQGNPLPVHNILIERLGGPGQPAIDQIYLKTYADKRLTGLKPWEESFAANDLPPGSYQISFWLQGLQQRVVEIKPGKLTVAIFQIK